MSQRAIFFASTGGGLLLFATLGYIQLDSRAFTSQPRVDPYSDVYPEVPVEVVQFPVILPTPAEPGVLTLPTLEVLGTPSTPAQRRSPGNAPHEASVPCSEWRELGPRHVIDGIPSGAIRVRNLC